MGFFVVEVDSGEIIIQDKDGNPLDSYLDGSIRRLETRARALLYDASGNAISSYLDGSVRRLETRAKALLYDADQNALSSYLDGSIRRLETRSKARLFDDVNDVALAVADDATIPENTRGLLAMARTADDKSVRLFAEADGALNVVPRLPTAPPGTIEFLLAADTPLEVGPSPTYHETVSAAIDNGDTLKLQLVIAGAAGDPSEKGSKVELYWREGGTPTDHLISRIYLMGETVSVLFPDSSKTRDGTSMVGDGSTTKLVIKRVRMSTAGQEIDVEARGYLI